MSNCQFLFPTIKKKKKKKGGSLVAHETNTGVRRRRADGTERRGAEAAFFWMALGRRKQAFKNGFELRGKEENDIYIFTGR